MSAETKEEKVTVENTGKEEENVSENKPNATGKRNLKWIVMAIIAVAAAVVVGFVTYTQSPSYKARQQADLGEKYLEDMDYEQAIASFQLALEIDPDNEDVIAAIMNHMDEFYQQAREYGSQGEFAAEKNIAVFMLAVDENSYQAMIADAEADCGTGEIKTARDTYEKAKNAGADAADVEPGIKLCDAILKLLELCETGDLSGIADFLNASDFEPVKGLLTEGGQLVYTGNVTVIIGVNEGSYYVESGATEGGVLNGDGVAVISSTNTNAVYEGSFVESKPEGNGILRIWNKNEDMSAANVYEGAFTGGILNEDTAFKTLAGEEEKNFSLVINQGAVTIYQTDEKGNLWLTDEQVNGCAYVVEYVTGSENTIADYVAGVPGFGGSDQKLSVALLDVTPPEITCNLQRTETWTWGGHTVAKLHVGKPEGKGIKATDNIDGDLTEKITYESTKTKSSDGYQDDDWIYGLIIVYKVTDSAGNTAELTVTYDVWINFNCNDDDSFFVVSVK